MAKKYTPPARLTEFLVAQGITEHAPSDVLIDINIARATAKMMAITHWLSEPVQDVLTKEFENRHPVPAATQLQFLVDHIEKTTGFKPDKYFFEGTCTPHAEYPEGYMAPDDDWIPLELVWNLAGGVDCIILVQLSKSSFFPDVLFLHTKGSVGNLGSMRGSIVEFDAPVGVTWKSIVDIGLGVCVPKECLGGGLSDADDYPTVLRTSVTAVCTLLSATVNIKYADVFRQIEFLVVDDE